MNQYIHHMPGRVRIKNPMFQNNTAVLDQVRKSFESLAGIEYITTNPLTGSLVINYDEAVIDQERVKKVLSFHINPQIPSVI